MNLKYTLMITLIAGEGGVTAIGSKNGIGELCLFYYQVLLNLFHINLERNKRISSSHRILEKGWTD